MLISKGAPSSTYFSTISSKCLKSVVSSACDACNASLKFDAAIRNIRDLSCCGFPPLRVLEVNEADSTREDDERARKLSDFIQSVVAAQVRSRIGGAVSPLHRIPYEHIDWWTASPLPQREG